MSFLISAYVRHSVWVVFDLVWLTHDACMVHVKVACCPIGRRILISKSNLAGCFASGKLSLLSSCSLLGQPGWVQALCFCTMHLASCGLHTRRRLSARHFGCCDSCCRRYHLPIIAEDCLSALWCSCHQSLLLLLLGKPRGMHRHC